MKIVARTKDGFLLSASEAELKSILTSFGLEKPEPSIGIEIPAGDFTARVNALKTFSNSYDYRSLKEVAEKFTRMIEAVDEQVKTISQ